MIRKAIAQNECAKIIVTGCYAQSNYKDLKEINGIDLILGNNEKNNLLQQIEKLNNNDSFTKVTSVKSSRYFSNICKTKTNLHTRALVKIQDGCNRFCSYCKVPYVRGPARSRSIEDILTEISDLDTRGTKEVVLLGINLGAYGTDLSNNNTHLSKLISCINDFKGIKRIRLSSIELVDLSNELLSSFAKFPKLCHHLHIPLQSADDKILKLMNRPYNSLIFFNIISQIMAKIPNMAITTDIMVGFPGEGSQNFINTYNFVEKMRFAKIHVFQYSEREECLANLFNNKVSQKIKKERSKKLLNLSKLHSYNFRKKHLGSTANVLIENEIYDAEGRIFSQGITDNYIKVLIPDLTGKKGELVSVKLNQIYSNYVISSV